MYPTLYKEAAKIKRPNEMNTDSVFLGAFRIFSRLFSILDSDFFRTRLDRPKLFIEQLLNGLVWIDPIGSTRRL